MSARILELRAKLRRAMQDGDMVTAEQIALQLSPFEEAICDELDQNPAAIVPSWGICA